MLLPVDDDGCDLLVHEDEYGAEESGDEGDDGGPPGVGPHRVNEPAAVVPGWLSVKGGVKEAHKNEQVAPGQTIQNTLHKLVRVGVTFNNTTT